MKKCKGLKKSVIDKTRRLEHYRDCLYCSLPPTRKMNVIRSRKHDLFSETMNKIALSSYDDKRHILPDKINTLALGHHRIKELENLKKSFHT